MAAERTAAARRPATTSGFLRRNCADQKRFAYTLQHYKYKAPSLSLIERHGLDRFWDLLTARVYPRWIAPNLITAAGGACVALAAALTLWHSPSLNGASPRSVYATNALLLFAYQSLDGSDGKQARRTGSGSPVGELMDHGIDAWAVRAMVTKALTPWPSA